MRDIIHILSQTTGPARHSIEQRVLALAFEEKAIGLPVSVWSIGRGSVPAGVTAFPSHKNHFALHTLLIKALNGLPAGSVVHLHGAFVPEYVAIARLVKRSDKKILLVVSPQGAYNEFTLRRLSWLKKLYYRLFERFVIRQASLIHLLGPSEINGYNRFIRRGTPFVCLPNGMTIEHARPVPAAYDGTKDPFVIVYSGPIDLFKKGLDILMRAFTVFSGEVYTPVELWIIGDGKDLEKGRQIAGSLPVSDRIKWRKPQEESPPDVWLQQAHVVVQPSRSDSVPAQVLKAAMFGVPVIVSEETNLGVYVKQYQAGWLLAQNTVADLLGALHEAYLIYKTDGESYARLNRNSYRMVSEELNWRTLARKWKEVYAGLALG